MNKQAYLAALKHGLSGLPSDQVEDFIGLRTTFYRGCECWQGDGGSFPRIR
ncbi:putative membrane protein [Undibacterium sp. GrIS 1.8]